MNKQRMTNDLAIIEDVLVNYCDITDIPYDDTYKLNFDRVNDFINVSLKEHELLELYRLLVNIEEEYYTTDSLLKKHILLDDLRDIREEISQLEEELKVKE